MEAKILHRILRRHFFSGFQQKKRPHEAVRGTLDEVLTSDCWKIFRLFFGGITKDALASDELNVLCEMLSVLSYDCV